MSRYSIDYTCINADGTETKRRAEACFFSLSYAMPNHAITSPIPVVEINQEQLEIYLEFLEWLLGTDRWTWEQSEDGKIVNYWLNVEGLYYKKALVYLTCFRYIKECPHLVEVVANNQDKTFEEIFQLFQDEHRKGPQGWGVVRGNDGIHTLLTAFGEPANITIDQFRANLALIDSSKLPTVFSHFHAY